ncbi:MAG: hypothetical protein AD742_21270 [Methylibium sp. NZG]|nr:MAG: hypothetical protein AD742_21270 [Methylibium sp. NZG]
MRPHNNQNKGAGRRTGAHPPATVPRAHALKASGTASTTLLVTMMLATGGVMAQPVPDAGQLLRESQQQPPRLPPLPAVEAPAAPEPATGTRVLIKRFRIEGATRFDDATLQAALAKFRDRELSFNELQQAADTVAERYRRDGWHVAAVLPEQDLRDGVLRIIVVESRLGRVLISPDTLPGTVPADRVRRYIDRAAPPGAPLNLDALGHATALANELPGVRAGSVLVGGVQPGETDVQLRLEPRPVVAGSVGVDNHDARSTGSAKLNANLVLNSPAGLGEQYAAQGSLSEGKRYVRLAGTLPVGDAGWRVGATGSWLAYKLIGDAALSAGTGQPNGARGDAQTVGINTTAPLWRLDKSNGNLSLAHEQRATKNETVLGPTSDKRVGSTSATLQGDLVDGWLGGGANGAALTLTRGRLDLSRVPLDLATDQASANAQGWFTRVNLTVSRLQRLDDANTLWFSINAQFANRNLDAGEKFALGGPQGVRAFPLLEGSGDEGWQLTVSWRHKLQPDLQVETFYDLGQVRRAKDAYAGSGSPDRYSLDGAGVSVEWAPANGWRLNGVLAQRLRGNPAALANGLDSDGTKRQPRVWLSATYSY